MANQARGGARIRKVTHLVPTDRSFDAPDDLAALAEGLASASDLWAPRVHHDPHHRYYERIVATATSDAWLIGWSPGQAIPAHDHGGSSGAVVVTDGQLVETCWSGAGQRPGARLINAGDRAHVFANGHVHAVANLTNRSATSIHVYSPPLTTMRWFDGAGPEPSVRNVERTSSHERSANTILAEARARLTRLDPEQAHRAAAAGALLVDIRPEASRRAEGEIAGALTVERNVLEWRLDPASPDRLPQITDYEQHIVLVCNEGYASSLAAASLQDLGLVHATDLDGGFRAWKRDGLPINETKPS
jgi:rhodanese-related sulfurtransferase/predicted metal-dependent enzyme (double-stranded beta helix superfamily)